MWCDSHSQYDNAGPSTLFHNLLVQAVTRITPTIINILFMNSLTWHNICYKQGWNINDWNVSCYCTNTNFHSLLWIHNKEKLQNKRPTGDNFWVSCKHDTVIYLQNILSVTFAISQYCMQHGPLTRYVKLRAVHAPEMPRTIFPPPTSKETAS